MSKPFDPQSTTFTNLALDVIMPRVSPNAWKIICLAIRKTAGWADKSTESGRKESDIISISQFRSGCGIASNDTVMNAINECLQEGYLLRIKEGQTFRYKINQDYELPTVTESVTVESPTVTESVTPTVTESVNTNSKLTLSINTKKRVSLKNKQEEQVSSPAPQKGEQVNIDEYKAKIAESTIKGMFNPNAPYAHFPERLVPVVKRMVELWYFKAPDRARKNGRKGEYAQWIEACDDVLDACAEFSAKLLDDLHSDWQWYMDNNGGVAPFTISGPQSLVKSVRAKAALMRSGNRVRLWTPPSMSRAHIPEQKQSTLDI